MQEICKPKNLRELISTLEFYQEKYGNIPVCVDLSSSKKEGCYEVESVVFGTDELKNKFISLIIW